MGRTLEWHEHVDRFWSFVDVRGRDECWGWSGKNIDRKGYARFTITIRGRNENWIAHRFMLHLVHGEGRPGPLVMHLCNNPTCTNPRHLKEGTQKENIQMAVEARRMAKGSRNGCAKLNEDAVASILRRYRAGGISQQALADEHGVSQVNVSLIVRRKKWQHVLANEF